MAKYGRVIHVGEKHVSIDSHTPSQRGGASASPKFLGPSYIRAQSMRDSTHVLHGDQNVMNFLHG